MWYIVFFIILYITGKYEKRRNKNIHTIYQRLRLLSIFIVLLDLNWPIRRIFYSYKYVRVTCDIISYFYDCITCFTLTIIFFRIFNFYYVISKYGKIHQKTIESDKYDSQQKNNNENVLNIDIQKTIFKINIFYI